MAPLEDPRPLTPAQEEKAKAFKEAGEYGTRFHAAMAMLATGKYPEVDEAMLPHLFQAWECLTDWMNEDPWFGPLEVEAVEIPYASKFIDDRIESRITKFYEETHVYDLQAGEFPGTFDMLLRACSGARVVLDIKTGRSGAFDSPSELPQLCTLAAQVGAIGVAVLHCPKEGVPCVYSEYIDSRDLRAHAEALRVRLNQVSDGVTEAFEGPECPRCPLFRECEGGKKWRAMKAKKAAKAVEFISDDT